MTARARVSVPAESRARRWLLPEGRLAAPGDVAPGRSPPPATLQEGRGPGFRRRLRNMARGGLYVEQDIRDQLARGAKGHVELIRSTQSTVDAALDGLVREAFRRSGSGTPPSCWTRTTGRLGRCSPRRPGTRATRSRPAVAGAAAPYLRP